jgi:3-hydroxyacyl-CoA dehydrogenase
VEDLMARRVRRGRLGEAEAARRLALLVASADPSGLREVDVAIEAVPERLELKRQVLEDLDGQLPPLALIASNTSGLAISDLAAATGRPERVAGFHFFYPAHTMRLIEVVAGRETSAETLEALTRLAEELHKLPIRVREGPGFVVNRILTRALAEELHKLPIRVREGPGFVVNRILTRALDEVFRWQEETGVPLDAVDRLLRDSGAVPLGPFQLADRLGLDTVWEVMRMMEAALGDRFRPGALLADRVGQGAYGVKTGQGFYPYPQEGSPA